MVVPQSRFDAFAAIVEAYCQRLPHLVQFRLDPRLTGRVSPAELAREVARGLKHRARAHRCLRWAGLLRCLRFSAIRQLDRVQREYLRQLGVYEDPYVLRLMTPLPPVSARDLASWLLARGGRRQRVGGDAAQLIDLQAVFNAQSYRDREILVMRHFEMLSDREVAGILQLELCETRKRYRCAWGRLQAGVWRRQVAT